MPLCHYLSLSNSEKSECEGEPIDLKCPSDISLIESNSSGFLNVHSRTHVFEKRKPPNIQHELNVAKSIMQEGSSITGDNLFDHLADIIKRVIKDRPINIVDYFEEFSHNLREQKYHIVERFPGIRCDPPDVQAARDSLLLMRSVPLDEEYNVCKDIKSRMNKYSCSSSETSEGNLQRKLFLNENVLRLHLYWMLCGFGFLTDEVLKLSYVLQKIQFLPTVEHARFWGKVYGLKKSYYVVEAMLTESELAIRLDKMREEMMEKMCVFRGSSEQSVSSPVANELIPGTHWRDFPEEDLLRMDVIPAPPIPKPKVDIQFDVPPEPIGTGLNRRTYFVTNSLSEEWIELPIVTPKQIQVSRQIKKFFTGDLEADLVSYPSFPGLEKHYLRTIIGRITSGTYLAPNGYYRKLRKDELNPELITEEEALPDPDYDEEDEEQDNDAPLTEDCDYIPNPKKLMNTQSWVHVRPNILPQGRVVYFDEVEAYRALQRETKLRLGGEETVAEEEEEEEVEEEGLNEDDESPPEPPLFTPCSEDRNEENVVGWGSPRYSSVNNRVNQLIFVSSNLWPGAYSYTFEKYADSIYMGWGNKYTARNMIVPQIPQPCDEYVPADFNESTDPTFEMEEARRLWLEMKQEQIHDYYEEEYEEGSTVLENI